VAWLLVGDPKKVTSYFSSIAFVNLADDDILDDMTKNNDGMTTADDKLL